MHETYRMLGKEREADLEREARRRDLAAAARPNRMQSLAIPIRRIRFPQLTVRALAVRLGLRRSASVYGASVRDGR